MDISVLCCNKNDCHNGHGSEYIVLCPQIYTGDGKDDGRWNRNGRKWLCVYGASASVFLRSLFRAGSGQYLVGV